MEHPEVTTCWRRYRDAAEFAAGVGLGVNAGHDLDLGNLRHFTSMGGIAEVSIGQALIADALEFGLAATVERYLEVLRVGPGSQSSQSVDQVDLRRRRSVGMISA